MANWHSPQWHSENCVKKTSYIAHEYRTITWVKKSAEEGCEGCRVVQNAVQKWGATWFPPQHQKAFSGEYTNLWSEDDIRIEIKGEKRDLKVKFVKGWYDPVIRGELEIFTEPDKHPSPWEFVGIGRVPPESSYSEESLSIIKGWIDNCTKKHTKCVVPNPQYVPYRVIDVGVDEAVVKLCESPEKPNRYIAFSHCWGGQVETVTTRSNLNERKGAILMSSLPRTFFDAVQLTRRLGVRYLWIDSLCIVQDDSKDWETESAKMHLVYSNAYLVIAATRAKNSKQGIFHSRLSKYRVVKDFYTGQNANGDPYALHARNYQTDLPCHSNFRNAVKSMDKFPLMTRTWALQERILATRTVHFCEDELVWECNEGVQCECMYLDLDDSRKMDIEREWRRMYFKPRWSAFIKDMLPGSLYDTWHIVVQTASRLAITKESDKLPALSGIAQIMRQKGAGTYLAGLWSPNLARDLLWVASAARPKKWRAPSWSWVSTEGAEVQFPPNPYFDPGYSIEVNHASCLPAGVDLTGEVCDGSITVTGLVTECLLGHSVREYSDHKHHQRRVHKGEMTCSVVCDSGEDADNGPIRMPVYALLVRRGVRDVSSADPAAFDALVLRKSQGLSGRGKVDGAFERIGIIQFEFFASSRISRVGWDRWFHDAERRTVTIV